MMSSGNVNKKFDWKCLWLLSILILLVALPPPPLFVVGQVGVTDTTISTTQQLLQHPEEDKVLHGVKTTTATTTWYFRSNNNQHSNRTRGVYDDGRNDTDSYFSTFLSEMNKSSRNNGSTSRSTGRVLAWNDYSETPQTCPALTTCPVICVVNEEDCPTVCSADENEVWCTIDGSCRKEECTDADVSTHQLPCQCTDRPIACPKVIDYYDSCIQQYEDPYYSENALCLLSQEEELEQVSFFGPWFLFTYIWMILVTCFVFIWCRYNQIMNPIENSTQSLAPPPIFNILTTTTNSQKSPNGSLKQKQLDETPLENLHTETWTQTGYKKTYFGTFLSSLVWITLFGFHGYLLTLTISYYVQQEAIEIWKTMFADEVQVLKAFELVWLVGMFWSFAFQWPESIESLFLRRCSLVDATHVAVVAPVKKAEYHHTDGKQNRKSYGEIVSTMLWSPFDKVLRFYFSYPDHNVAKQGNYDYETIYSKVNKVESTTSNFSCRMGRFVYSEVEEKYIPSSLDIGKTLGDYIQLKSGLTNDLAQFHHNLVGPNILPLTPPSFFGCIYREFSKAFYIYQHFMVWTWYPYWFYYMALVNTVVRVTGGLLAATFQYMSDAVLFRISVVNGSVTVLRDGTKSTIEVKYIVPGDVVVLQQGTVYCDMVLLKSQHLMVDEAALTGESTPIMKLQLDAQNSKDPYDESKHKAHTIYAGTEIIERSDTGDDLGLVIATGSFTLKGKILTDILSYQRSKFLFDDEIKIVLVVLAIEAIILMSLVFSWLDEQVVYAFFYCVFILGTVIPPLLPTVFVVSVGISANRLQQRRVTCTNPDDLLVAGKVNACCFDKTGTITETGMEFVGVDCGEDDPERTKLALLGMSVCHSLKVTSSGELIGNHVDKASFQASGSTIHYEKGDDVKIAHAGSVYTILKQFEFDNHQQTQSVIVSDQSGKKHIFVKGSPESIRALCQSQTIPESFEEVLRTGSKSGIYQLAIGYKEYTFDTSVETINRTDLESSLSFGGFVLFQNKMKAETPSVMRELMGGNILMTMITGDNVLTGICIARESGMSQNPTMILGQLGEKNGIEWIDVDTNGTVDRPTHFTGTFDVAVTGEAWRQLLSTDYDYALLIAKYVRVFGRCNPTDKISVVNTLIQLGYITLMCGDGQNDCGALKSAHVGVALSSSDASIVAPFTSLDKTVTSVTDVLREGRCALSSAFKAYSYYIIYGQVESYLQTICAYFFITFAEWSWVFLDGVWSATMAFSLSLAGAAGKLSPCRPTASLLGPRTMFSVCGLLAWNFFFIVMALVALNKQEWYQCRKWDSTDVSDVTIIGDNYETSILFIVGGYQYISSAIALSFGYTFRAAWYKNYVFVLLITVWTISHFTMTLYPSSFSCIWRVNCDNENALRSVTYKGPLAINNNYNTTVLPEDFRWILLSIMITNLCVLCCWEYFFVNGFLYKYYKFDK